MYYRLLNKGKTFRFLTIQFLIMECALKKKKTVKKQQKTNNKIIIKKKKKAGRFQDLYYSRLLNRWMNSVQGVFAVS